MGWSAGAAALALVGGAAGHSRAAAPRGGDGSPSLRPVTLSAEESSIATGIAQLIKHDVALALAGRADAAVQARGYAGIVDAYARKLPRSAEEQLRRGAADLLRASDTIQNEHFGRLGGSRPMSRKQIAAQHEKDFHRWVRKLPEPSMPLPGFMENAKVYQKVSFRLVSVTCKEETDEVGADEILLGGVAVHPFGEQKHIAPFKVSNDFDKGETVTYPPVFPPGKFDFNDPTKGKSLATFSLVDHGGKGWPGRVYGLNLVMGEQDSGGFSQLIHDIWKKVGDEVTTLVATGVGAAIGGSFGGIIGAAAGAVVGFVVGLFKDALDNKDDLVGHQTFNLKLDFPFTGSFTTAKAKAAQAKSPSTLYASSPKTLVFKGDGGRYDVKLSWRVHM